MDILQGDKNSYFKPKYDLLNPDQVVSVPKSNQAMSKALLKHYKTTEPEETEEAIHNKILCAFICVNTLNTWFNMYKDLALDQSLSSSVLNCIILCSCLLHLIRGLLVNSGRSYYITSMYCYWKKWYLLKAWFYCHLVHRCGLITCTGWKWTLALVPYWSQSIFLQCFSVCVEKWADKELLKGQMVGVSQGQKVTVPQFPTGARHPRWVPHF